MKLISDRLYGDQRAYIGAISVIMTHDRAEPTAAICTAITVDGNPCWTPIVGVITHGWLTFQPDPTKLVPGEWCWPVTQPPITAESYKEVRQRAACGGLTAKTALKKARGEIDGAVKICGGDMTYFGPCCHATCRERATGRDAQTREWCDAHVPEGVKVWKVPQAASHGTG